MTFGLTIEKLLLIGFVAALLIGPSRLPHYASLLARLTRRLQELSRTARARITDELGTDVADLDWSQLDPRKYDPRRIIREALLESHPEERTAKSSNQPPTQRAPLDTRNMGPTQQD